MTKPLLRLAAWPLAATIVGLVIWQVTTAAVWGNDLQVFWTAGHRADTGVVPWVRGYDYAPAALTVFAPLGALSFQLVRIGFLVGGVLVVAGSTSHLARRLGYPIGWALAVTFAAFPTLSALEFANATLLELPIVLALTVAVADVLVHDSGWRRVTVLLILGLLVKPVVAPCLLVLVLARRWRQLAIVVTVTAMLNVAALAAVGHVTAWYDEARESLRVAGADPASADVHSVAARHAVPPDLVAVVLIAVVVLAATALLQSARHGIVATDESPQANWLEGRSDSDGLIVAAVLVGVPLIASYLDGPVAWAHYPLLLLPLVAILLRHGSRLTRALTGLSVASFCAIEPVAGRLIGTVPNARLFILLTGGLSLLLVACVAATVVPSRQLVVRRRNRLAIELPR